MKTKEYHTFPCLEFCCVAACLKAILASHGYSEYRQLDIALALGLTVPRNRIHDYHGARVHDNPEMWGEHINENGYTINEFLSRNSIKLKYSFFLHNTIPFKEYWLWVEEKLNEDADILAFYDSGLIKTGKPIKWGHCSLIIGADDFTKETLILSDPTSDWINCSMESTVLVDAMRSVRGGFGIIKEYGITP